MKILTTPIKLDRLMEKLPDGSFKVVGYEIQRHCGKSGIQIMQCFDSDGHTSLLRRFSNINAEWGTKSCWVHHDRKDRYTGQDYPDGGKVFERDQLTVDVWKGDNTATIIFKEGAFVAIFDHAECYLSNELKNITHTGIEGTK